MDQLTLEVLLLLAPQAHLLGPDSQLTLRNLGLAVQPTADAVPLAKLFAQHGSLGAARGHLLQQDVQLLGRFLDDPGRVDRAVFGRSRSQQTLTPLIPIPGPQLRFQVAPQLLVFLRTAGLPFEIAQPRRQLADDVARAREVAGRIRQLLRGLLPLALVDGDAGGFLEEFAPLFRPLRQRLVHQTLADDAVGALAEAGAAQQLGDVAQADAIAVQEVLVFARTIGAAADLHLAEVDRQPARGIVEDKRNVSHTHARPLLAAREDHVLGALAAQGAIALLTQDPAQGIGDVRLAAAVRADDGRYAGIEHKLSARGKGFVALEYELLEETHRAIIPILVGSGEISERSVPGRSDLVLQPRLDERIDLAVQHRGGVADLHAGAQVLDHLVRLQDV